MCKYGDEDLMHKRKIPDDKLRSICICSAKQKNTNVKTNSTDDLNMKYKKMLYYKSWFYKDSQVLNMMNNEFK